MFLVPCVILLLNAVSSMSVMDAGKSRTVLVSLGERNQIVTFRCEESPDCDILPVFTAAALRVFEDVVPPNSRLLFQVKSEEWGGAFLDLLEGSDVPDKSLLKAVVLPSREVFNK